MMMAAIPAYSTQTIGLGGSEIFGSNAEKYHGSKYYSSPAFIAEYELSGAYRDGLMLNCGFSARSTENSRSGNCNGTIGFKYVPEFYFPKSDTTDSAFRKNKAAGFLMMPFSLIRDSMIDVSRAITPSHPFFLAGVMFGKHQSDDYHLGYFIAPGLTSGFLDIKMKFAYCFYPDSGMKQAFREFSLEMTFHVSFTGTQVRTKKESDL